MSTGIIELIKKASLDVIHNSQMCDLRYGTVVSTSPLKVRIINLITIPSSLLVVPQHLTDYTVECTITQQSQDTTENPDDNDTDNTENNEEQDPSNEPPKESITIYNALKIGDKVALLRKQGGQSYFILDRI